MDMAVRSSLLPVLFPLVSHRVRLTFTASQSLSVSRGERMFTVFAWTVT